MSNECFGSIHLTGLLGLSAKNPKISFRCIGIVLDSIMDDKGPDMALRVLLRSPTLGAYPNGSGSATQIWKPMALLDKGHYGQHIDRFSDI